MSGLKEYKLSTYTTNIKNLKFPAFLNFPSGHKHYSVKAPPPGRVGEWPFYIDRPPLQFGSRFFFVRAKAQIEGCFASRRLQGGCSTCTFCIPGPGSTSRRRAPNRLHAPRSPRCAPATSTLLSTFQVRFVDEMRAAGCRSGIFGHVQLGV